MKNVLFTLMLCCLSGNLFSNQNNVRISSDAKIHFHPIPSNTKPETTDSIQLVPFHPGRTNPESKNINSNPLINILKTNSVQNTQQDRLPILTAEEKEKLKHFAGTHLNLTGSHFLFDNNLAANHTQPNTSFKTLKNRNTLKISKILPSDKILTNIPISITELEFDPEDSLSLTEISNNFQQNLPIGATGSLPNLTYLPNNTSITINENKVEFKIVVYNNSSTSTSNCRLSIIMVDDELNIIEVGYTTVPPLGSSEYKTFEATVDRSQLEGCYYPGFWIDSYDVISESDEDDNVGILNQVACGSSVSTPNLTYDATNTSLTVTGTTVNLSVRVVNDGNGSAPTSSLLYYLIDEAIENIYPIGIDDIPALAGNAYSNKSLTVDVASLSDIPAGTYYIGFMIDAGEVVAESNEDDNVGIFTTSSVSIPSNSGIPNLTYDSDHLNLSVNGTTVNLSVRVVNNGTGTAGTNTLSYYLVDEALENIYSIGTDDVTALASGAYSDESISVDVATIPEIPVGTYYIGFWIDNDEEVTETSETDNGGRFQSTQVTIPTTGGTPNLTYDSDHINLSVTGTTINLSVRVVNNGTGTAAANILVYYITDEARENSYIIGHDDVPALAASAYSNESIIIDVATIPNIPAGNYYIGFWIDNDEDVAESNETDNGGTFKNTQVTIPTNGGKPNLTYDPENSDVSLSGTTVNLTVRVVNNGNGTANASSLSYLLVDEAIEHLYSIGTDEVASLESNSYSDESISVDVATMSHIPAGNYFIGFWIDYDEEVDETDETDNAIYYHAPKLTLGGADIEISPAALTIHKPVLQRSSIINQTNTLKSTYKTSAERIIHPTGLVIPDSIKSVWRNKQPGLKYNVQHLKSSVDWSIYDSPVKDQKTCGGCWAFSAIGLIENKTNHNDLSEQTLISCAEGDCDNGGWYDQAFEYMKRYGVPNEDCYPFKSNNGMCDDKCTNPSTLIKVKDYQVLWGYTTSTTVNDMKAALQTGPVCIAMWVPTDYSFQYYSGGIYTYNGFGNPMGDSLNHAVLLVGYNDEQEYFLIKNSWGTEWGENGYVKIAYECVNNGVALGSFACTASPIE